MWGVFSRDRKLTFKNLIVMIINFKRSIQRELSPKRDIKRSFAFASILYDVLNHISIDAEIAPYSSSELQRFKIKTAGVDSKSAPAVLKHFIMIHLFYLASSPVVFWNSLFTFIVWVPFVPFAFGSAVVFCGVVVVPGLSFVEPAGVLV